MGWGCGLEGMEEMCALNWKWGIPLEFSGGSDTMLEIDIEWEYLFNKNKKLLVHIRYY